MPQHLLPDSQIEVLRDFTRGRLRHALFDFDGTISLLREGWEQIMQPVCVEIICGDSPVTPEVERAVAQMIDETTGIQTIFQMERLVEMVREFGLVPEDKIPTPVECKARYNDRLLVPVRERLKELERGMRTAEHTTVRGIVDFLEGMKRRGVILYVFSGTDRDDVRNEAGALDVSHYFEEIWGALPSVEDYSKEKIIREIIATHGLQGSEVLAIGDGPVELRNVKAHGGVALGVASDEETGHGWNPRKRQRLTDAGADLLVPDFSEADTLLRYLFDES